MRIDAHQHFWRYDAIEYGWIDATMAPLRRDFVPSDALTEMRACGFDACVAVQARQTEAETRWLLALADSHPFIAGVVGWVDLCAADVERRLAALAHPKLVGIRHIVQAEPDGFLARADFRRGIAALTACDLPFDILVYARQLRQAIDFAAAFPAERFVLDHLGKPDISAGAIESWHRDLRELARLPNVWAKLSGLVTEADWRRWTPAILRPYLDAALDAFGSERLMIGSDWPVCSLAGTYGDVMGATIEALADCGEADREAVLGGSAQRFWNLPVLEKRT